MIDRLRIFFSEGYRVFFLAASLYAVFALTVWEGWLGVHAAGGMIVRTPFAQAPHLWHGHEMIFGYATAAMGGFFLTAVPNWTGAKAARQLYIGTVSGVWLAGRVAIMWSGSLDPIMVAAIDLAFIPILSAKIATQLIRKPKPQNLLFLLLLAILWSGNVLMHLEWNGVIEDGVQSGMRTGLFGVAAMIAILGGRITPAFTKNAMTREGIQHGLPTSSKPATIIGIASALTLPILFAVSAPDILVAATAVIAGTAQAVRLSGWKSKWTVSQPILWSMHLAYTMLTLGYLLLALSFVGIVSDITAIHVVGIGAVGGMTLAVMSRAILGHSGLPLKSPRPIAVAYALVAISAAIRGLGSIASANWYFSLMLTSGALWIAAFTLFIIFFWPILTNPQKPASPHDNP